MFLGDGKNCPYGSRSREEIQQLADAAVARLVKDEGCKMVVVACNTATAAAIDFLRAKYAPVPFVGMGARCETRLFGYTERGSRCLGHRAQS